MSLARGLAISLVVVAACSSSQAESNSRATEEPWSHAYSGASDGWWRNWLTSLDGKAPFGPGTQFEIETLGPHGIRQTEVIEVVGIRPGGAGTFVLQLRSSNGSTYRSDLPPALAWTRTNPASVTARTEKLVSVTVPAGTFKAGRLWTAETSGTVPYERDEWVVPDLPVRVQSWYRPAGATDLYNPPADGNIPEGTVLTRLVRIDRK